jgi:bacteriocin biosynthesis cyclodehydratase domain-containing protein
VFLIPFDADSLQVATPLRDVILSGQVAAKLVPRLAQLSDGVRTVGQIITALQAAEANLSAEIILQTFDSLRDYFVFDVEAADNSGAEDDSMGDFFSYFTFDGHALARKLGEAKLAVVNYGWLLPHVLAALRDYGMKKITVFSDRDLDFLPDLTDFDLLVFCADYLLPPVEEKINRFSLHRGIPWIRAVLQAHRGEIGPLVIPRRSACWKCGDLRSKANRKHYEEYLNYEKYAAENAGKVRYAAPPGCHRLLAEALALECVKYISGYLPPAVLNAQLRLDFMAPACEVHPLLKLPRCPHCGAQNQLPPQGAFQPGWEKVGAKTCQT